jgi:hypothetical protein
MTDLVSAERVRLHLRYDGEEEDSIVFGVYLPAAINYIRKIIDARIPGEEDSPPDVPEDIQAAILLVLGDMYGNRETQVVGTSIAQSPTMINLVHFYRGKLGM